MKYKKFMTVTYEEVDNMIIDLSERIKNTRMPDTIFGILRGAAPIGLSFSDKLFNKNLHFIEISRYYSIGEAGKPKLTQGTKKRHVKGKHLLICDDVSDDGITLEKAIDYFIKLQPFFITTATLHIKTGTRFVPDFYAKEVPRDIWIIYPWGRYENGREILKKNGTDGIDILKGLDYTNKELEFLKKAMKFSEV